jgi:hypothetical protein
MQPALGMMTQLSCHRLLLLLCERAAALLACMMSPLLTGEISVTASEQDSRGGWGWGSRASHPCIFRAVVSDSDSIDVTHVASYQPGTRMGAKEINDDLWNVLLLVLLAVCIYI